MSENPNEWNALDIHWLAPQPGRPRTKVDRRELVLRMVRENRSWGYTRIQGTLANLRHEIGRGTIANNLREPGLDPTPDRRFTAYKRLESCQQLPTVN